MFLLVFVCPQGGLHLEGGDLPLEGGGLPLEGGRSASVDIHGIWFKSSWYASTGMLSCLSMVMLPG